MSKTDPPPGDAFLRQAIEALAASARRRLEKHPQSHLALAHPGRGPGVVRLELEVPLSQGGGALADAVEKADADLSRELESLLRSRGVLSPGRLYCLRCTSPECEHSVPEDGRQIFAGYGSSGLPRWVAFGQWLLERQHPRLDDIYRKPPRLVTERVSGQELGAEVLDIYRDDDADFRLHGQVTAGWYAVPPRHGGALAHIALSFQVISSRRRFALNVLGRGPGGEPLGELYERLRVVPWQGVVAWGQQVLASIEKAQTKNQRQAVEGRIEGLLKGLERRLSQDQRARGRRTDHAEKRHHEGDRPTRMAFADLARGDAERVLFDRRHETLIVLGERGRAHVFNPEGKLVTSIRYSPESIERKKRQEIWRPASDEEVAALRDKAGVEREDEN